MCGDLQLFSAAVNNTCLSESSLFQTISTNSLLVKTIAKFLKFLRSSAQNGDTLLQQQHPVL